MVAAPKLKTYYYTPEEYFEIDARSEERLEYVDGEIIAMAGEAPEHNEIAINVCVGIRTQFRGRPCKVYIENVRAQVSDSQYRYPDIMALCGEPQFKNTRPKTLLNPMVIFEVLSESTADKDMGVKFDEYTQIVTLTDYVLVAQDTMRVRHFHRLHENDWQIHPYTKAEDIVRLESLDVSLTLADIYNEVTLVAEL